MSRTSSFKNKQKVEEQVEEPVEEVKQIALKKKERKQRKKRGKKAAKEAAKEVEEPKQEEPQKEMYDDIMSYGSDIMGSSITDFVYEPKEIKTEKKSMLSKLASKVSPFSKKEKTPEPEQIKSVNDEPLPEPVKSDKPTKESIMAKLAALQANRAIAIQPKAAKKQEEKPKPKPTPKPTPVVMKELVITSDEKKIEQLKEKAPKTSENTPINYQKAYKFDFDLSQEDDVCMITFNNDKRDDLTLYRMTFNKKKMSMNCSYFCGAKWTTNKRIKLKTLKNVVTFKATAPNMYLQVQGVVTTVAKRRNHGIRINYVTHNLNSLKIV